MARRGIRNRKDAMNWIKVRHGDLECALNKPQLEVLRAAELASPGRDIAEDVISSVTARIRAEIAAGEVNALDPDHSKIPPELKECATSLALEALQARIPALDMPESIAKRADLARETLRRVAASELPVTRPVCGIRAASKKGLSFGRERKGFFTSKNMEGL